MNERIDSRSDDAILRLRAIRLFQVFIVLCLVDGFLDISYPLASFTKSYLSKKIAWIWSDEVGDDRKIDFPESGLPTRHEPGVRSIMSEYHSKYLNIDTDGMRYNGRASLENVSSSGFILGASVAFGWGVADDQTISAYLERAVKEVRILNYAGTGQSLSDNIMRWHALQKRHGKPNFVILANTNWQIFYDCLPRPDFLVDKRSNIFFYLFLKLSHKLAPEKKQNACASSKYILDMAVDKSMLDIENAVAFGRKQGIPFYVVYLPTPFDRNLNVDNLLKIPDARELVLSMRRVFSQFHQELGKLKLPELIDLSDVLPPDKMYFLDVGGHLSKEANILISEALFNRIWRGKQPPTK